MRACECVHHLHQVLPWEVVSVVGDAYFQSRLHVCNVHLIALLFGLLPEPFKVNHLGTKRDGTEGTGAH